MTESRPILAKSAENLTKHSDKVTSVISATKAELEIQNSLLTSRNSKTNPSRKKITISCVILRNSKWKDWVSLGFSTLMFSPISVSFLQMSRKIHATGLFWQ